MELLRVIGYYLSDHLAIVFISAVGVIFLMFFFVAIDLFNIRKEAVETNMRMAEMNKKMSGMNNGIQELVHHFVAVTQDLRKIKQKADSDAMMPKQASKGEKNTFEDYIVGG